MFNKLNLIFMLRLVLIKNYLQNVTTYTQLTPNTSSLTFYTITNTHLLLLFILEPLFTSTFSRLFSSKN